MPQIMFYAIDVCNRFSFLSIENSPVMESSQATDSTSNTATSGSNVDDMSSGSSSTSLNTSSTTSSNNTNSNGGSGRTYCCCCYCEQFGHSGPPTAPISHNYTKQRDKMRVKLEMKKQRDTSSHDYCFCSNANHPTVHATTVTNSKHD